MGRFRPRVGRGALRRVARAAVTAAAVQAVAAAAAASEGLGFTAGAAVGRQGFAVGELRRCQLAPPPPARPHLLVQAPVDRLHFPHLLRRWRQLRRWRSPRRLNLVESAPSCLPGVYLSVFTHAPPVFQTSGPSV